MCTDIVARGGGRAALLISCLALIAGLTATAGNSALAQQPASSCSPAVARLVSLQGNVELQRSDSENWLPVTRLDTALCAGDRLRTDAQSRAALFVQPETLVRVDRNTTITLNQSTDEIEVEFFTAELAQKARNAQSCGAGYFITRFPKKFKVVTPHMNAAVEGTEFMVESSCDATKLTVLEGKVSSESVATRDTRVVMAGQSVESGTTGEGAITTVVKPQDAVQWVLRYPPLSDGRNASQAEKLLRAGSVDDALTAIDEALKVNPADSDAHALRAVIQIAKNDKTAALESAAKATAADDANYRAWLALSYAQQAAFDLQAAVKSARKASSLQPGSSLAHARVAELYLSLGDTRRAEEAARAAIASDPAESHAHSMLGFVHLVRIDTNVARADFGAAIERDSFSALPRLGLGLAVIRDGDLEAGREQLEIAVALDPSSSLLRSYVGKAYYEENSKPRDELASTQFEQARARDPKDPTPWFYDAILKVSQNRPIEALQELQASIEKNGNRAVYRSTLLLEDDAAARTASVASVYENIGFEELAIVESAKALGENAGNSSAHRELASAYANLPRHDIARVSEALQAQIRQPVTLSPISPQLTTDNLVINRNTGPARTGTSEFNALFNKDDVRILFDGIVGGLDTFGDQFVASGLLNNFSYALSQLHYETDGFVENDAAVKDIYDLLLHGQISPSASVQLDAKRSEFSIGETFFPFDEFPLPTTIIERSDSLRASGQFLLASGASWIWSAITEDRTRAVRSFPDGGLYQSSDASPFGAEIQYLGHMGEIQVITGAGYFDETEQYRPEPAEIHNESGSAYMYAQWRPAKHDLEIQFGLAAEQFKTSKSSPFGNDSVDRGQISPKLGIVWAPRVGTTLRAAAFSSVHRPFVRSQTIEPTQVAGFNQFFSGFEQFYGDFIGTVSDRIGIAVDQTFSPSAFAGLEVAARRLEVPSFVLLRNFNWHEKTARAYYYKTFSPPPANERFAEWQASFSAEFEYEKIERPQVLTGAEGIMELETAMAPIGVQFFNQRGTTLRLATSYVAQQGLFSVDVGLPVVTRNSAAWITDVSVEQRLPGRRGVIAVGVRNLFDENIDLVEIDPVNPRVATKQFLFTKFSLVF